MTVKIDKGRALDGINMTPMIDCVFLLLIFFLVASKFEEAEREMSVVLPQASEAMPLTARPKELFVNVSAEGEFVVRGQRLDKAELLAALEEIGDGESIDLSALGLTFEDETPAKPEAPADDES